MHGKGPYTTNGIDGMAFKASKYSQHPDWPDLRLHFLTYSCSSDHGVIFQKQNSLKFALVVVVLSVNRKMMLHCFNYRFS